MVRVLGSFFSLYLATLVLLLGAGLFNTYLGLRLTAASVSEVWVGGLIAIYYLGLVFGARVGHKLIQRVGHIRAYAASAAFVTVAVLAQILLDNLWIWLLLRFMAGLAMVTQFIVIESWLNEQTENQSRGGVFALYMLISGLGTVLGQLALTLFQELEYKPLIFVAICFVMSLVPVTLTRRIHPNIQMPAPIVVRYYLSRVPMSLMVLFIAGLITGAFYGLAPVYATKHDMSSDQVAIWLAASVAAGLLSQWPLGWLADRISRIGIIRVNAGLLLILTIPLWGWFEFSFLSLVVFSCAIGILQFTLYPLGAAFANDNIDPERRVGLSAILYMVYGLGACIGPLLVGVLMGQVNSDMYYVFVSVCALFLVLFVRPQKITGEHLSEDAPTQFVPMYDSLQSSNVVATMDPRVDVESDLSHELVDIDPDELDALDQGSATTQATMGSETYEDALTGDQDNNGDQSKDNAHAIKP